MGQTLDPLSSIESNSSPMPMILPLSQRTPWKEGDCPNFRVDENGTVPFDAGERQPAIASSTKNRYAFPLLPPSRKESPKVQWPECVDSEEAKACAKAADCIFRKLSRNNPAVLAFTSPRDGDGKTSLLVGIAPELAKRTAGGILVVDANFQKPDLLARLTLPVNRKTVGPALIFPTNHPGLNVLLPAPQSRGFDFSWLEGLRESWPLVLLDMPSLEHVEATSLLRHCTGVYLAVRLGHTPRRAITEASRLIPSRGGRLLGCLVVGEEDGA